VKVIAVRKTILAAAIIAAIMLSGCTAPGTTNTERSPNGTETISYSETDGTVIIDSISVSNDRLRPGSRIELTVVVENRNTAPAHGILRLGNTAPLTVQSVMYTDQGIGDVSAAEAVWRTIQDIFGDDPPPVGERKYPRPRKCRVRTLEPGPRDSFNGEQIACGWRLQCETDSQCAQIAEQFQDNYQVPLTLHLTYNTSTVAQEKSIGIEFRNYSQLDSSLVEDRTYTTKNGDISLTTDYQTPLERSSSSFSITNTLRQREFTDGQLHGPVDLSYIGSMKGDDNTNGIVSQESLQNCNTIFKSQEQTEAEVTCPLQITRSPKTEFVYRMFVKANYTMSKTRQRQVSITPVP